MSLILLGLVVMRGKTSVFLQLMCPQSSIGRHQHLHILLSGIVQNGYHRWVSPLDLNLSHKWLLGLYYLPLLRMLCKKCPWFYVNNDYYYLSLSFWEIIQHEFRTTVGENTYKPLHFTKSASNGLKNQDSVHLFCPQIWGEEMTSFSKPFLPNLPHLLLFKACIFFAL